MSETLETRPVFYHTCKMLGANTKVPRALLADPEGKYILAYQHKCPFCSYVAGDRELAPGVTLDPNGQGYIVDTTKAETMQ